MAPPVVDTHVHVAGPEDPRFPRSPTGVGRTWWQADGYAAEEVAATARQAGVDRVLAVQAVGVYGYDNAYILDAAGSHPELSVVVALDPADPGTPAQVAAAAKHPGVVGVRLFGVYPGADWAGGPAATRAFDATAAAGLPAVLTVWADDLVRLRPLIEAAPTPVVVEHLGFPTLEAGRLPADHPVLGLADAAQVTLKVTSHNLVVAAEAGDPAVLVGQLAEAFGPERLLWGSDYPQTEHESYRQLVDLAHRAGRLLGPEGLAAFLGGNATRVFALPGA